MAQNFAGVSGSNDARNDIIIRGNSPAGVLWRMEGIDIPNPNHYSTLGFYRRTGNYSKYKYIKKLRFYYQCLSRAIW